MRKTIKILLIGFMVLLDLALIIPLVINVPELEDVTSVHNLADPDSLRRFVAAYQTVSPLRLGELWAFPIMLRLALIENLRRVAVRIAAGKLAPIDPHHLIFSIWSTTQHYADFDVQVRGILDPEGDAHFGPAAEFLETFYRRVLTPK